MKRIVLPYVLGAALLFTSGIVMSVPLQVGSPVAAQARIPQAAQADPLNALSDRFEAVAAKVLPAVVSVEAIKPAKLTANGKNKPVEESGSGVVVKSDAKAGYFVLTNNHVVSQSKNEQITVTLADGRIFRPTAVFADPESDLAILAIDSAQPVPTATLGNSDNAKVGRWVLAIGSPFGLNQSVTHGIISARDRGQVTLGNTIRIKEFLQTDAAINPGSSGGPLIDMNGEVIGINTAIASHNGSNSGVAFSIPSNLVKRVMNQLLAQGTVQRGYLGMQLALTFDPNDAIKLGRFGTASERRDSASGEHFNSQRESPDQPDQRPQRRPAHPPASLAQPLDNDARRHRRRLGESAGAVPIGRELGIFLYSAQIRSHYLHCFNHKFAVAAVVSSSLVHSDVSVCWMRRSAMARK
jgi:S1-C subfamily serine protease